MSRARGPHRATSGTPVGTGSVGSGGGSQVVHVRGPVDHVGVVGGGDDRATGLPVGRDEPDDGRPGAAVLADGRLVGEQHGWAVVQCRGHREAALFASRELAWVGCLEVGQAERREQGAGPVGRGGATSVVRSVSSLFCARPRVRAVVSTSSRTVRATIVELDHCGTQARVRARSGPRARRVARHPVLGGGGSGRRGGSDGGGPGGRGDRRAHLHGTGIGRREEPGEGVQHGRLARPARPDQRGQRAGRGDEGARSAPRPGGSARCRRPAGWCARPRRARPQDVGPRDSTLLSRAQHCPTAAHC